MAESNKDAVWGFHLNETMYSLSCPPCPKWANSWEQQNWHKLGVVVWDTRIKRVTHLHGNQVVHILEQSRQSKFWKKEGLLVGEVAYRIAIPSNKKSKSGIADQLKTMPSPEDGWCLTHTIQLAPDQAQQFVSFLEQQKITLEKVVKTEAAEKRRMLGQVYSLILSWAEERKKGSVSNDTKIVQETAAVSRKAVSIPHGKYLTIAQVAQICGVKEKTVSEWLKKGLLNSLDLPGLGKIIEERDLQQYLVERRKSP